MHHDYQLWLSEVESLAKGATDIGFEELKTLVDFKSLYEDGFSPREVQVKLLLMYGFSRNKEGKEK